MRISLATTSVFALLLAGCGRAPDEQSRSDAADSAPATTYSDSASELSSIDEARAPTAPAGSPDPLAPQPRAGDREPTTPPNVTPDAAPDVAFGYHYTFGLATDRIAPVQQRHARLCEELGPERCKVTGMNYRQRGEKDV
jgi:hypothetical protein